MEIGIDFGEHIFLSVNNVIENLGWERFVKSLEAAIMSIVRDFYANVPKAVNNRAMVKGVFVLFNVSTIKFLLWYKGCSSRKT